MLSVRAGGGNELVKFVDVNAFHLFHLAASREACEKLQMGIISSCSRAKGGWIISQWRAGSLLCLGETQAEEERSPWGNIEGDRARHRFGSGVSRARN